MPQNTEKKLRILSIEDAQVSGEPLLHELNRLNYKIIFKQVSNAVEFKDQLKNHSWDLVISNYNLPDFSAFKALELCREHSADLPFILVVDKISEEDLADMMKAGVEDVVVK